MKYMGFDGKKAAKKEEQMAKKSGVKFEKTNVWISKDGEVEEVPGYRFKFEMSKDDEVYVGLVKQDGGWLLVDTYTGTSLGGIIYRTRDAAAKHFFETVITAYRKVFMTEMHEAKASDFNKKVLHAKGFETKGEQVKEADKELAKKAKSASKSKAKAKKEVEPMPEPETVEAVAVEQLSFIDGDAESAEKAMTALRTMMEGGNVVVRWKGKPMAPIRVEGDTKPYQKELKEAGLRWARKGFWYLKPTGC